VAVIVTDISRDGKLAGPDVTGLAGLLELTGAPLVASGGVASLDDLRLLAAVRAGGHGLEGVIVGKAIYEGAFTVADAVAACRSLDGAP
jgi:phosphoribosylformimino-5-aminoimidazole carboxamide ribonucleotide (ProFAR) isomerase